MMGAVGSDDYGQFCIRDFERHGIDVSGMKVREGETTSLSIVSATGRPTAEHRVPAGTAQPPTSRSWTGILETASGFSSP